MSFGKFSVRQIIQNAACGMFCFEILNKEVRILEKARYGGADDDG